tara:strand:+ start:1006 stop:1758 length:753 start_codon:yes stop_codon:yes gene_type:complete
MTEVYRYDDINFDKLKFSKPQKQNNYYYSNINYNDVPFFLQTSKLKVKDNIKNTNMKIPSIEFEISNDNFDMYDLFMKLDDKLVKTTYNNSKDWFNQTIPLENIEDMYKCICKPLKKNKNPILRFKLALENNEILSKIYDQNRQLINITDCQKDHDTILILHIRGIKFMKQQYICDIYINQMKVNIPKKINYLIPDECLISEFDNSYDSDEDILKIEIIEMQKIQENEENIKKNKIKKLKDEIERLEKTN